MKMISSDDIKLAIDQSDDSVESTLPKVTPVVTRMLNNEMPHKNPFVAERDLCLEKFIQWNDFDQLDFVEQLLERMKHRQYERIDVYLKRMLQRDFISLLSKNGMDHVAQKILLYLDVESLKSAELVSKEWFRLISTEMLWKRFIERKVRTDHLWQRLSERRNFARYLFKPQPNTLNSTLPGSFYRSLYAKIIRDLQSLEQNWQNGNHELKRINCHSINVNGVICLQFDDSKIVCGLRDNTIKIWDRSTLKCSKVLTGHTGTVKCLQYNETAIFTGSRDTTIRVWDIQAGAMLNTFIHHKEAVQHLRFKDNIMVSCSKDHSIAVWEMSSRNEITLRHVLFGHQAAVNVVDFDDEYIVSGGASGDRSIKVWDTKTFEFVRSLDGHAKGILCLQYRDRLIVSASSDSTIRIWDVELGKSLHVLKIHADFVRCLHFDAKRIVSGTNNRKIMIWDLGAALDSSAPSDSVLIRTMKGHHGKLFQVQSDEFQIVSSSHDDTILIWDYLSCTPFNLELPAQ